MVSRQEALAILGSILYNNIVKFEYMFLEDIGVA